MRFKLPADFLWRSTRIYQRTRCSPLVEMEHPLRMRSSIWSPRIGITGNSTVNDPVQMKKERLTGQSAIWGTTTMKIVFTVLIMGLLVFFGGRHVSTAEEGTPREQPGVSSPNENVPSAQEPDEQPGGEIQERGLTKGNLKKIPRGTKVKPPPNLPGGNLPANLCHQETHMMTQCQCSNSADCQVLSNLCPGSCPIGSQTCQCTPLFRGTPPPLPQNLCGYQVPFTITKCSCSNDADCQVLSSICPGSCPVGSQSCQCTPLQRR